MPYKKQQQTRGPVWRRSLRENARSLSRLKELLQLSNSLSCWMLWLHKLHPYLTGVPHRIKYLEMLYDYILGHHEKHGGVVMWTGAEILDWYRGQTK